MPYSSDLFHQAAEIPEANAILFVPFSEDGALISITGPFTAYYATEINFKIMNGLVAL